MEKNNYDTSYAGNILKKYKTNLIITALILIGLFTLPLNYIGIVLFIVIMVAATLLYQDVTHKTKPRTKKYAVRLATAAAITVGFLLLITWLKGYGWIGFVILVLGFSVYRIWRGRKVFVETSKYLGGLFKKMKEEK